MEGGASAVGSAGRLGTRLTALCLAAAGVFFVLYPAIRPFSDESSLHGAEAFASKAWVVAHSLAMAAFILLSLGLLGLYFRLAASGAGPPGMAALVLGWVGVGLTLPYYGAETFGLHAVGQEAVKQHNAGLLSIADAIRYEQGIWFILLGLIALAAGTIVLAVAIRRSGSLPPWSGWPLAAGMALYLPQFFAPQPVRLAHGVLVMVGCLLIAWGVWQPAVPSR
jgi:hypothetical protein